MTVSLWRAFLILFVVRQSIEAGVNLILGTYCKGAVGKKGDKILAGMRWCRHVYLACTYRYSFVAIAYIAQMCPLIRSELDENFQIV